MGSKLYIGNLSFQASEDDLKGHFGSFGAVSEVHVVTDKFTGRSRGFAFVTYESDEDAQKAIAESDGKEFMGRELRVNEAKPKSDSPRGGGQKRERY